ncbi:MAG: flagellar hook-length control protein FliK [Gaiellales bacterium]
MKTERPEGPQEPDNGRQDRVRGARPRRGAGGAASGFGNVMADVRKHGGGPVLTPGMPGFDQAAMLAAQSNTSLDAAKSMGAVKSGEQLANDASMGVQTPVDALTTQDRSASFQAGTQPAVPTNLGKMTPSTMLTKVLDEATKLEIAEAMKELHVELEPEDLGPLVVRLRKGPDGTLDISFRAREGEAARVLEQGTESLRERLNEAGFASVTIDVSHDSELELRVGR